MQPILERLKTFAIQHTALMLGIIISLLLLSTFLVFQYNQSDILKLESRWLLVSGVPLLAALVAGGYIKSFKGFGIELEARLNKPVSELKLTATEAMTQSRGDNKRSLSHLHNLSLKEKRAITRLTLIQGRLDYYNPNVLNRYIQELRHLKYIEIQQPSGQFIALIPVSELRHGREISIGILREFIHSVEGSNIIQDHPSSAITTHVSEDTGLIDSLKIMRKNGVSEIAVLNNTRMLIGLLLEKSAEKQIVNYVLTAKDGK